MSQNSEIHPLDPFLPGEAKVLMLGSFPPPRIRWSMDFYYPNLQNDMWRIMGLIFADDTGYLMDGSGKRFDRERIVEFCTQKGIALSDTARSVIRLSDNASDKFLQIVEPQDIQHLIERLAKLKAVVTTGEKATETFCEVMKITPPKVGEFTAFTLDNRELRLYRMPSSSRAYPKPIAEKAEVYKQAFAEIGLL